MEAPTGIQSTESRVAAFAAVALWLHFFWCLVPSWQDGLYYDYGWLVPPLAAYFAWRRWSLMGPAAGKTATADRSRLVWGCLMACLLLLIPIRFIGIADPAWRPPIWIHAFLVVVATHGLLALTGGWRRSWFLAPVTLFALTAVPYPWQIEQGLVRHLTGAVTGLTQELFLLRGVPVERFGETLLSGSEAVEVGEGCSGIRSLQSLLMAALFFGELTWLPGGRRVVLVGIAAVCALVANAARSYGLAGLRFSKGLDAAESAHDLYGHLAFAFSATALFLAARLLQPRERRRLVIRQTT